MPGVLAPESETSIPFRSYNQVEMANTAKFLILGILFILIGIGVVVFGRQQSETESRLDAKGTRTAATVRFAGRAHRSTSTRSTDVSAPDHYMLVDFPVGGQNVEHKFWVTEGACWSHPSGSTVEVLYDGENPNVAVLLGGLSTESGPSAVFGGVLAIVVGAGLLGYVVWSRRS